MAVVVARKTGEDVAVGHKSRSLSRGTPTGQIHIGLELTRLFAIDTAIRVVFKHLFVGRIHRQPSHGVECTLAQIAVGRGESKIEIAQAESLKRIAGETNADRSRSSQVHIRDETP